MDKQPLMNVNQWFVKVNGLARGPYTIDKISNLLRKGNLSGDTQIREESSTKWQSISSISGLFPDDLQQQLESSTPANRKPRKSRKKKRTLEEIDADRAKQNTYLQFLLAWVFPPLLVLFVNCTCLLPLSSTFWERFLGSLVTIVMLWCLIGPFAIYQLFPAYQARVILGLKIAAGTAFAGLMVTAVVFLSSLGRSKEGQQLLDERDRHLPEFLQLANNVQPDFDSLEDIAANSRIYFGGTVLVVEQLPGSTDWKLHVQSDRLPDSLLAGKPDDLTYLVYIRGVERTRTGTKVLEGRSSGLVGKKFYFERWQYQLTMLNLKTNEVLVNAKGFHKTPTNVSFRQVTVSDGTMKGFSADGEAYVYPYHSDGWVRDYFNQYLTPPE